GQTNLTISSMSTTGDFSVGQNCVGRVLKPPTPSPLGPLFDICSFNVTFSPTNTGTRNGTVIVNDTALDSPQTIQLTGLGLAAWPTPSVAGGTSTVAGTSVLPLTGAGFSRVTTATVDGIAFDNLSRQITVASPQELDLALAANDFGDIGEVPVRVVSPT